MTTIEAARAKIGNALYLTCIPFGDTWWLDAWTMREIEGDSVMMPLARLGPFESYEDAHARASAAELDLSSPTH